MANTLDDFESERSRAAVAVACLEWLRCTGPATAARPVRATSPEVAELLRNSSTEPSLSHDFDSPHPLWDRWIDG